MSTTNNTTTEKVISKVDLNGNTYKFKDTAAREQLLNHNAALIAAATHINDKDNPHQVELSDFGINATATEINVLSGVNSSITSNNINNLSGLTENVQSKLNNHNTALQNAATHIGNTNNPHQVKLSDLGVSATAAEINVLSGISGVTSSNINNLSNLTENVQSKLSGLDTALTQLNADMLESTYYIETELTEDMIDFMGEECQKVVVKENLASIVSKKSEGKNPCLLLKPFSLIGDNPILKNSTVPLFLTREIKVEDEIDGTFCLLLFSSSTVLIETGFASDTNFADTSGIINVLLMGYQGVDEEETTGFLILAPLAPMNHASSEELYGLGDNENYGHVKLSDTASDDDQNSGIALTPKALWDYSSQVNTTLSNLILEIKNSYLYLPFEKIGENYYSEIGINQVSEAMQNGKKIYCTTDDRTLIPLVRATPYECTFALNISLEYYEYILTNQLNSDENKYLVIENANAKRIAPENHSSEETTYGLGNQFNYGHVKLSDTPSATNGMSSGMAATPKALEDVRASLAGAIASLPNSIDLTGTPTTVTPVPPQGETAPPNKQIANVEYVKQEINKVLSASEAMTFKGVLNAATGTPATIGLPFKADVGDTYKIGIAAKFAGQNCEIGDLAICLKSYNTTPTSNFTTYWVIVQSNIDGAVTGPTTSIDKNLAIFDGTTGKIITDSKVSLSYVTGLEGAITEVSNKIPIVYNSTECTSFTSDIGTKDAGKAGALTPAAAAKAAKQFAITRPPKKSPAETVTDKAVARWQGTNGDLQDSKIKIEDVTNTVNNKKAQVISIPTEPDPKTKKDQKMVYGYCTDQVDGTSFIGGLFPADATSYPYAEGLAIGGTTGNLLWKGRQVVTAPKSNSTQQAFIVGTASPGDNMNNQIFDPWIYLGAEEGQLVATKFTGDLDGNAASADTAKALTKANGSSYTEGSATKPVYFKNGKPVATTYALNATVPTGAKFTDNKVTNTLAATTKAYITGTEFATTNTGTQVFDTGVYLGTTAGQLVATTFKGNLDGNAATATQATKDGSGKTITETYQPIVSGMPAKFIYKDVTTDSTLPAVEEGAILITYSTSSQ